MPCWPKSMATTTDDFVVDDDGAGYTHQHNGNKRLAEDDSIAGAEHTAKRFNMMRPQYHEAFQPGATPGVAIESILCLNLIGFVWTVDQDTHNTVTVEFYDHEFHRDFTSRIPFSTTRLASSEHGTLFSCPPKMTSQRPSSTALTRHGPTAADWRTRSCRRKRAVLAMSLSDSFVTVTTTAGYVRVYTLFGIPYRVYRPKNTPMVSCASWRDYVLAMGNGPAGGDRHTNLCTPSRTSSEMWYARMKTPWPCRKESHGEETPSPTAGYVQPADMPSKQWPLLATNEAFLGSMYLRLYGHAAHAAALAPAVACVLDTAPGHQVAVAPCLRTQEKSLLSHRRRG